MQESFSFARRDTTLLRLQRQKTWSSTSLNSAILKLGLQIHSLVGFVFFGPFIDFRIYGNASAWFPRQIIKTEMEIIFSCLKNKNPAQRYLMYFDKECKFFERVKSESERFSKILSVTEIFKKLMSVNRERIYIPNLDNCPT